MHAQSGANVNAIGNVAVDTNCLDMILNFPKQAKNMLTDEKHNLKSNFDSLNLYGKKHMRVWRTAGSGERRAAHVLVQLYYLP